MEQARLEASVKVEKTRLEVSLDTLQLEKRAAAAEAKAEALEAAIEEEREDLSSEIALQTQDSAERVKQYVEDMAKYTSYQSINEGLSQPRNVTQHPPRATVQCQIHNSKSSLNYQPKEHISFSEIQIEHTDAHVSHLSGRATQEVCNSERNTDCRDHAVVFNEKSRPHTHQNVDITQANTADSQSMSDLVRFFARRELVSSGLLQFSDQPESYRAWKASFWNATKGLNLTCSEEMDLLLKWLGTESAAQVRRIRAVHIHNPQKGLKMAWDRLDESYGSPEVIENSLFNRLDSFPKLSNKDHRKLRELGDLLMELEAAKLDGDLPGLTYLDTARGINPIVQKLPYNMQEKWLSHGSRFKEVYNAPFPPFGYFVDFVCQQAKMRNDPSFSLIPGRTELPVMGKSAPKFGSQRPPISVHKSEVSPYTSNSADVTHKSKGDYTKQCPLHNKPHPLQKCRGFREKSIENRKAFLKQHGICYKCCASSTHLAKNCDSSIKCAECGSESHTSVLHPGPAPWSSEAQTPARQHGGEEENNGEEATVSSSCTQVCGGDLTEKSCAKICLVKIYPAGHREKAIRLYAILDDQSNRSLVKSEFFDLFNIKGHNSPYSLKTCAGVVETAGRRAHGFQVESMDGHVVLTLPTLIECNAIPNNRSEIPTPEAALHHAHLKPLVEKIPELDPQAPIMVLLGRDIIRIHKVRRQINGPHNSPYAQKLDLGWVIVGNICLGNVHKPTTVSTYYTNTLENGRHSVFGPCPNRYVVKEKWYGSKATPVYVEGPTSEGCGGDLGYDVFQQTREDDKIGPSVEDLLFLKSMEQGVYKDEDNSWVAPLPFRQPRPRLPNNRSQAVDRLSSLRRSFNKKPEMKDHFMSFMEKIFQNGHAEEAPPLEKDEECWFLPSFGVYHPKKPGQIRVVFDSSAQHKGVSLNQVLLTGPDLNNSLLGVLIRFRKDSIAITGDIQQMFHCFVVRPDDRNFLRFLWYRDNILENDITEYRMKVHVFGNSPSPAVAIHCLRRAAEEGEREFGKDARHFVERDFYVDDGLKSLPTTGAAIDLLKRTQSMLACSNLRLHKIASNSREVMEAFPVEDHASDLKDLDLGVDSLPIQRSLGLCWDLKTDTFLFKVEEEKKPFTRRGVLSTVNSLYDPLGFVAPVTIQGKALLRELSMETSDWDAPLPSDKKELWDKWRESLKELQNLKIPRPYTRVSPSDAQRKELCVFADASDKAIAAVAYLRITDAEGNCHIGFVLGKARLAPRPEQTIPRLELCAAVMAVEMAEIIAAEIDIKCDAVTFYTDSKVVLGYIYNDKRRFYVYVTNRIQRIRRSTQPQQWHYVSTERNPADHATRSVPAARLKDTTWLTGPMFISQPEKTTTRTDVFELVDPEQDKDIRTQVTVLASTTHDGQLGSQRFERFSTWGALSRALSCLRHIVCLFKKTSDDSTWSCKGWHHCGRPYTVEELIQSRNAIIRSVQQETYAEEMECIRTQREIPKNSPLRMLDPFIDEDGLLRVGGRIQASQLGYEEKRPLIIPGMHHVASLLVKHHHVETQHQGRQFTEGAVRSAGYWIVGAKRCVSSLIFKCITCRKLRGTCAVQKMADLPPDRLSMEPPFTNVGIDAFGPWTISARRTRGGYADDKRWAVLFTCLSTRAIHLEVIESMDSSSFINALRRFLAVRGPVKQIRSDRGTNFIGACKDLGISSNIDNNVVRRYLSEKGCTWTFNPPHSSHMGGAWERMIGITRRILDSMLLQSRPSRLTHEVLTTFMAEVMAIVNNRPLVPVSMDAQDPFILTPATLLTQKSNPHPIPPGKFDDKDMYRRQWRQVQSLANTFWDRWRKQYLSTLQSRRKWASSRPNITPGSVVLMRDCQSNRNDWPLGVITQVFPSKDGRVRKVEVKINGRDGMKLFLRPVTEVVLLFSPEA
ncbi:uncharacterized protein LOC119791326 [Cyprinodon tularosa]|uniref:uncharacterized protein LOC119791326 n=1 Tax=Cyprinodon tularosa TaxID=77115 RepID=UPI0018E207A2|nr:uncharacterized protein LOC119791326 [Cyprinodon tularosa]